MDFVTNSFAINEVFCRKSNESKLHGNFCRNPQEAGQSRLTPTSAPQSHWPPRHSFWKV